MRLGAIRQDEVTFPCVLRDDGMYVLREHAGEDVGSLIALGAEPLQLELDRAVPLTGYATTLPPIRPGKIVAIGLNYMDHIREVGVDAPKVPLVFAKFPSSLAGNGQRIAFNRGLTERVDWEVELAVVIGDGGRDIVVADALTHVFGYTVANDLSARDLQASDGQWVRAKSLDGFCPLGPQIVTADEVPDPQRLALRTVVNGEVMQDSSTSEMVFSVAELIAFCSGSFTLDPGDVILTGTPWGCGEFMNPRRSLQDGDVVSVSVSSLGTLSNPIEVRQL